MTNAERLREIKFKAIVKWNQRTEPIHGNEYETPIDIFSYFHKQYNFIFDIACNENNIKCKNGFTYPEYNALEIDWPKNGWLWLNPPYKPLKPWIQKTQEQHKIGAKIVMLIPPVVLCCKYFQEHPPSKIVLIGGRIKFLINGMPMKSNTRDSCVLIYDDINHIQNIEYLSLNDIFKGCK